MWAIDGVTALIPKSAPRATRSRSTARPWCSRSRARSVAALLFGLAPILHARKTDLHGALKDGSTRHDRLEARLRARRTLVIAEIALAVVLVIGCTVMVRSFVRLQRVELGFKPDHVLTFELEIPPSKTYPAPTARRVLAIASRIALRALPGVDGATLVDGLPPSRPINATTSASRPHDRLPSEPAVERRLLAVHRRPTRSRRSARRIVRGRDLAVRATPTRPLVVLVNEAFAAKFFPGTRSDRPAVIEMRRTADREAARRPSSAWSPTSSRPASIKPAGTEVLIPRAAVRQRCAIRRRSRSTPYGSCPHRSAIRRR